MKKLNYEFVTGIRKLYESGKSQAEIARLFELSPTTIMRLVKANFNGDVYRNLIRREQGKRKPFITMISKRIAGVKSVVYSEKVR